MHTFHHLKIILSALLMTMVTQVQAEITDADLAGLKLTTETKKVKIYVKSGADLSKYESLYVASMATSFDAKWLRDYNRERKSLAYRLNKRDEAELTERYGKKFQQTLSRVIANTDGVSLAADLASADLKVETAIVNLQLNAPGKMTANLTTYLIKQAGEAELHTKMYDAKTGELLVAIIDEKETREHADLFQTSRVRNISEFLPMFKSWTKNWFVALGQKS